MPLREPGERLGTFISRFVGTKRERKKFPELKQRLAVGYAEAREHARKHGGKVGKSGTYLVGEEGPEVLHLAPGSKGYVDPNPATKAYMSHRAWGGFVGVPMSGPSQQQMGAMGQTSMGQGVPNNSFASMQAQRFNNPYQPFGINRMMMRAKGGKVSGKRKKRAHS